MKYKQIDKYQIDLNKPLGNGSFASVYLGWYSRKSIKSQQEKTQYFAVKQFPISSKFQITQTIIHQINLLRKINHPNIVKFIDARKTSDYIYIVMEYCNQGSLVELLCQQLTEQRIVQIFREIVSAFLFLNKKKIIHRDIKPNNMQDQLTRLMNNGSVKIADFGLSTIFTNKQVSQFKGTLSYMSPQILEGKSYTYLCDVWSLGVTLYQMIYNELPWSSKNSIKLFNEIQMKLNKEMLIKPQSRKINSNLIDLLKKMLTFSEKDRISWQEIAHHQALFPYKVNFPIPEYYQGNLQDQMIECIIGSKQEVSSLENEEEQNHGNCMRSSFQRKSQKIKMGKNCLKQIKFYIKQAQFFYSLGSEKLEEHKQKIREDLFCKCKFLLLKRSFIMINNIYIMLNLQKNYENGLLVNKEEFQQLIMNIQLKNNLKFIRQNVQTLYFQYKNNFEESYEYLNKLRMESTIFNMINRGQSFTEQPVLTVNLIKAFNDNFLSLFKILAKELISVIAQNKQIKKATLILKHGINIHFVSDLLIILTFNKCMKNRTAADFQKYEEGKKKMDTLDLFSRIQSAYNQWMNIT